MAELVSKTVAIGRAGSVREAKNVYQLVSGGYRTFSGYERFSGQVKPSASSYGILPVALTGAVSVGDTVTDDAGVGDCRTTWHDLQTA